MYPSGSRPVVGHDVSIKRRNLLRNSHQSDEPVEMEFGGARAGPLLRGVSRISQLDTLPKKHNENVGCVGVQHSRK